MARNDSSARSATGPAATAAGAGAAVAARVVNPAWLDLHREAVLEPELSIVDPHHHLWERPGAHYGVDDYLADAAGHRLESTVFVECTTSYRPDGPDELKPLGETAFACAMAIQAEARPSSARLCAGIVGYVDLGLGAAVESILNKHLGLAGGRFKGVRNSVSWHSDESIRMPLRQPKRPIAESMLADPKMRAGAAVLGRFGLSFDVWLYHPQLDELAALAKACPSTSIIVNHLGGPLGVGPYAARRADGFAEWRAALARLAAHPNVWLKFGGLGMRVSGLSTGADDTPAPASSVQLANLWRPYFDACMESFGPRRSMFESNFPMDKGAMRYATLWNAFKRLTHGASVAERDALFRRTAMRVYRLDPKET